MAYKYYSVDLSGDIQVRYDVTPDFSEVVVLNQSVIRIVGQAFFRNDRIGSISCMLYANIANYGEDVRYRSIKVLTSNMSVAANKWGNFSFTFDLNDENNGIPKEKRAVSLGVAFGVFSNPYGASGGSGGVTTMSPAYTDCIRYYLSPKVIVMDFDRANDEGVWLNDGHRFQCRAFKISIAPEANVNDISKATIIVSGGGEEDKSVELSVEQLQLAISDDGYFETMPQIFVDAYSLGITYSLTLTIGDKYEQIVYADTVPMAFANIHLSGASTGGVAFGMFSSAKEEEPKLESMYPAYFYAGFGDETIKMLGNVLYPVGAIFMCSDDVSPIEIYGGQWEQIKDKFLLAAGDSYFAGDTGGSAQTAIPAHNHISPVARNGNLIGLTSSNVYEWSGNVGNIHYVQSASGSGYSGISRYSTGDAGAYTVSTIPPYYVVNIWRRTELYDVESNIAVAKAIKNYRRLSHEQLEDK